MRTRSRAKRRREEDEKASVQEGTCTDVSGENRCKNLMQQVSNRESGQESVKKCPSIDESTKTQIMHRESEQGAILPEFNTNETKIEVQDAAASIDCTRLMNGKDTGEPELDWEDGAISTSCINDDQPDLRVSGMTIEFNESPSSTQRRTIRRASSEDKILAELVHKVHLLCLLARGRLIDCACSDPLIQASVLSLLPPELLNIVEAPKLTISKLAPLVNWFHSNFHVQSSSMKEGDFKSNLKFALGTCEGTAEEVAALSVALFRALNLSARFVSILDVASLKPDADVPECSNQHVPRLDTKIHSSSSSKIIVSPNQASTSCPIQSPPEKSNYTGIGQESTQRGTHETKLCNLSCNNKQFNGSPVATELDNEIMDTPNDKACHDILDPCMNDDLKKPKRRGDIEFGLQLEMALSATAMGLHGINSSTEMNDISGSLDRTFSLKTLKKTERGESTVSAQRSIGAVWSRKAGPPLCWAEVYCSGEALTGRWVHVDAANGIIDGEQQVESALAACRRLLKYVIAFAGLGAKDVTRRYCLQWYKIASQRINSSWWDMVLAPLKQLESAATRDDSSRIHAEHLNSAGGLQREITEEDGSKIRMELSFDCRGAASRESLEDMELETRALTEPLPTNQVAYRNHQLYVIERWLTKYQILHPKGPVLGYCSGHSVYPRSCVQTLQTKQKWLREGMQVKASEAPAKVVKRSQKLGKAHTSEPNVFEDDDIKPMIELYGKWQVEPLCLPPAIDGIVPKNERGQVEVWSEKCLPPGTVHLRLPRLIPVVKRLEVDFAPAMVGFEFRNGRSYPIFEGIVICKEFKDAILEAYAEEEERRETEDKKRSEVQALSRWYQLLYSIIARQRLKNAYEDAPHSPAKEQVNNLGLAPSGSCGMVVVPSVLQQDSLVAARQCSQPEGDHEHVFPTEYESFDKDSAVRTKCCPCGFSIQMEEL